jgi:AcrR family transcriptional regulator
MNEKTKEKIQTSFLDLLQETHFTNVSVRDITTEANINRGTFYRHYLDKYDLLAQIEGNLLEGLASHLQQLKPDAMLSEAEQGETPALAVAVYRYIQSNAQSFITLLGNHNPYSFHHKLQQLLKKHFLENMAANKALLDDVSVPKDYLSSFAVSAFLGLIQQWLDNNLKETPEEMAGMYIKIILFIKKV